MTVVNPKSISGINSITTGSGSDNLLTIHTSDANNTERVRVNSSGDVIVGSGVTLSPDGDVFATGVTTSTTFVGNLTGNVTGNVTGNISGGTVAGSTGTFSDDVTLTGTDKKIISNSSSSGDYIRLYAASGTGKWDIYGNSANLRFSDNDSSGNIQMDRPLVMNSQNIVMSSGNGIDFSATGDGSGTMENELLDDYEEGRFTGIIQGGGDSITYTLQRGSYTKIGDVVYFQLDMYHTGTGNANTLRIGGLPFDSKNQNPYAFGGAFLNYSNGAFGTIPVIFHIPSGNTYMQVYNRDTGSVLSGNTSGVNIFNSKEYTLTGIYKAA